MIFRLNEGLWRYISIWDLKKIVGGVLAGTIVFYCLVNWGFGFTAYPRSIYIIDSILLVGFLSGIRLTVRLFRERKVLRKTKRVLIIGLEMLVKTLFEKCKLIQPLLIRHLGR